MILHYLGMDHIGHKAGPRRCHSLNIFVNYADMPVAST